MNIKVIVPEGFHTSAHVERTSDEPFRVGVNTRIGRSMIVIPKKEEWYFQPRGRVSSGLPYSRVAHPFFYKILDYANSTTGIPIASGQPIHMYQNTPFL